MIRGTDGYDYEDLGARIRDEKAPTLRNTALKGSVGRARSKWPDQEAVYVRSYRETYDYYADLGHPNHECAASAHAQANFSAEYARSQDPAHAEEFERRQDEVARRAGLLYTGVPPALRAHYECRGPGTPTHSPRGSAAGACGAHPGQAPADPVHAAHQPPVHGRLGSP